MTSVGCQGLLKHKVHFWGHRARLPRCLHLRVYHLRNVQPGFFAWLLKTILDDLWKLITVMLRSTSLKRAKLKKKKIIKQGRTPLWYNPDRITRVEKSSPSHILFLFFKCCVEIWLSSLLPCYICVLLITKDRCTAQSSMIRACRLIIPQKWTYKWPKINEFDPHGSNWFFYLMPMFIILCFKGHGGDLFICRHFFETLIVCVFLTTLSDNSTLKGEISEECMLLVYPTIKITRMSLRNNEGHSWCRKYCIFHFNGV